MQWHPSTGAMKSPLVKHFEEEKKMKRYDRIDLENWSKGELIRNKI
jgi:hypothetical protein